jgi:MFS family permease
MIASLSLPFVVVTLANFFFFLNFAAFFLLPLHVRALGGSEATVGALMGSAGLAGLVVLPAVGMAIDRFGRRGFLIAGASTMTLSALCFLLVDSIGPLLYVLRVVQGISFAMAFTASTTLAAALAPADRRAQALGLFGLSTILTHALGPGVGEEIVRLGGFPALFVTAAVFSAVSVVLAMRLPSDMPSGTVEVPRAPWRVGRLQWVVAAIMIFCGMGFGAVVIFIPTYVRSEGLGRVSLFFVSYTIAAILTRVFAGGLSDTFGRRAVVLPTLLMLATSIFMLSIIHSPVGLVLTAVVFGLAQGVNYPTLHAFLVDLTAAEYLGRAQALFNGAFNLGVTSGGFLFGVIAEHFGHRPMFVVASATPLLAWALLYGFGGSSTTTASFETLPRRTRASGSGSSTGSTVLECIGPHNPQGSNKPPHQI